MLLGFKKAGRSLGMSLLEVMIAFTLFATVMVLLASVWVTHARAMELGQDQEVAANLCQMFMEQSLQRGYATGPLASAPFVVQRRIRGQIYDSTFYYTVNVTTATAPPITSPLHKVVQVKVEWADSTGNHSVHMESNAAW